ncbi:MAG: flagellar hook-basal body complex protein FliE [Candidatus Sericytochromatia bacterium]
MEIERIVPGLSETPGNQAQRGQGFADMLNQGIEDLSRMQNKSADLTNRLAAGEDIELHDVMIASQEADVALRLATQMRTQVLEAYHEVMRMPI